ncbi:hypothetical protein G6F46_005301 [Rhizopus delemar]|uniref:Uncharacterized protein n=2 Tax=Rhizopus TaxID=4842 RepID=A0A9P6Z5R9_9FUNG|nr:hypothetical protein G6F55_004102 [Rhizopus delemar]KAG1545437.1 hypothetical protein G6F51_005470 [Rhizopus arrhizus]KAG1527435.1 hypothetical protein G6F52_001536 [Rhizopus delemar]KAG1556017.1 hypothetical protein G6F49_006645 [Rhizopus delemar]KAG1570939.1 hypothetical protein G6F50_005047 [Rhizopus delemar]
MTRRRKNIKQNVNNDPNDTQRNKPEAKYTSSQLEQTKLAKQLESYIVEFETKINQLNYKLLNRELVILFIANLHPRWKRLVEPVEHTFQQWEDAANAARYHCIKLSALLGGERVDTSPLFITQESLYILQSGYFAPETNPDVERYFRESSIQHLLSPTFTTAHMAKNTATVNVEKKEKTKDKSHEKEKRKEKGYEKAKENENVIEKEKTEKKVETKEEKESEKVEKDVEKGTQKAKKRKAPTEMNQDEKQKQETKNVLKQQNNSFSKVQNNKNKNNGIVIAESDIYYTIPECYKNVNLMFLSLDVNGRDVKGLLSKLSWENSAISVDCIERLGLPLITSDSYRINTELGFVSSLGFVNLPILHPADPNIKSELMAQVLPKIYNVG